jgi:hypothetical protein
LDQLISFSKDNGAEFVGAPAGFFKELANILDGQVAKRLKIMETMLAQWQAAGCRLRALTCGYVMARVYALLFQKALQTGDNRESPQVRAMAGQCIQWFQTCVTEAREMGAQAMEGQALLGLGQALAALGEPARAIRLLNQSVEILDQANASHHLEQAKASIEAFKT